MAPVNRSRLRSFWPIFDTPPSLGLPPVVCCRGTRPSQAEKPRPRRKLSIGGMNAWMASGVIRPTPGIIISRAVASSSLGLVQSFGSSLSIRPSNSLTQLDDRLRQAAGRVLERRIQLPDPGPALRGHDAVLGEVAPERVDRKFASDLMATDGALPTQRLKGG